MPTVLNKVAKIWRQAEERPGLALSALAHLAVLLLIVGVWNRAPHKTGPDVRTVLVDIVRLGERTMSPAAPQTSVMPQEIAAPARRAPRAAITPVRVSPVARKPPPDDLQSRLNALAKLSQPADPRLLNGQGTSSAASTSNGAPAGDEALYSLRDFVRAQVMRRWNLDLGALGTRNLTIAIHVAMRRDGVITASDIVDRHRYATDAVYRALAMSARNAVLLSSPIALPAGSLDRSVDMTLNLDPRDALR